MAPTAKTPWPYARVIAHRGGGSLAPENTIAAIDVGYAHGFRAIEFDTRLSRDGVPMVIHDATLERTTDGRGAVADAAAEELARLDAGRWHGARFEGTRLAALADVLRHCRAHGIWPNVEIKEVPGAEAAVAAVVARSVAERYGDWTRPDGDQADRVDPRVPLLSSFSRAALAGARQAVPGLPRGWLTSRVPDDWRAQLRALGCVSLHCDHAHLTAALARAVKEAGYWLFCYTVNDPRRAREILGWGVDAFCTDRIDLIGADFAARGPDGAV
jgi:glycerophosphoryl diester phosphodiesterase